MTHFHRAGHISWEGSIDQTVHVVHYLLSSQVGAEAREIRESWPMETHQGPESTVEQTGLFLAGKRQRGMERGL